MQNDESFVSSRYYGKEIRLNMFLTGLVMLILIPLDRDFLHFYVTLGVLFVIVSVILAALTSRRNKVILVADLIMSLLLFCIFEYMALESYLHGGFSIIFALRQIIAVISIISVYLSTRTLVR